MGKHLAQLNAATLPVFEFELGDEGQERKAPTEFRLLRAGVNATDKGDFLFDEDAAAAVMACWREKGVELMADWEHQSMCQPPVEAPASATWVPEVRNGELWATSVKWTLRAKQRIEAKEYRYFSPAFLHDPKTGRVQRLINFALTNNPAMHQLEPLVAASAATDTAGENMEEIKALQAKLAAAQQENEALNAKLSAAATAQTQLTALRSTVHAVTGKGDDAEAIGVLTALKAAHSELTDLKSQLATERTARLSAEFNAALDQASKDGKIPPAQRAFWDGQAKTRGVEDGLAMLKAFCETATALVSDKQVATVPALAQVPAEQARMAASLGISVEAFKKSLTA